MNQLPFKIRAVPKGPRAYVDFNAGAIALGRLGTWHAVHLPLNPI
jgi:hypothetical protein